MLYCLFRSTAVRLGQLLLLALQHGFGIRELPKLLPMWFLWLRRDPHAYLPRGEAGALASAALLTFCVVVFAAWSAALALVWAAMGAMLLLAVQLSAGWTDSAAGSCRGCWIGCWPSHSGGVSCSCWAFALSILRNKRAQHLTRGRKGIVLLSPLC
jgi:hypothetical protein